jgi:hypothetical protein
MRHLRAFLMLVALVAAAVAPVKADLLPWSGEYSGGNTFATTASISVTYNYDLVFGFQNIQVTVANMGTDGEVFKAIGLFNVPAGFTYDAVTSQSLTGNGWTTPANELGGAGLDEIQYAFKAPNPAPDNGLKAGQPALTFYFKLTPAAGFVVTDDVLESIGVGIHAISGPGGCSTKFGVYADGEIVNPPDPAAAALCGQTTVPEPSTVVLLGTGLMGLLGVAYRRRREDGDA